MMMATRDPHGFPDGAWLETLVAQALSEDVGSGDASTAVTVAPGSRVRAEVRARSRGVAAGLPLLDMVFGSLDDAILVKHRATDGDQLEEGAIAAVLEGPAAPLLTGERTALNFLQHLGGIATLTAAYVAETVGTRCRVLDTRKTLPGYRHLAKYAVRCGGGHNHRMGLWDRIMLKDNHWAAAAGDVAPLVARARADYPRVDVEVEVDDLVQFGLALEMGVEWILLDNFSLEDTARAVDLRDRAASSTLLEASGNVNLKTIAAIARTGVDAASVGRLTHSAPALDLGLDLEILS